MVSIHACLNIGTQLLQGPPGSTSAGSQQTLGESLEDLQANLVCLSVDSLAMLTAVYYSHLKRHMQMGFILCRNMLKPLE